MPASGHLRVAFGMARYCMHLVVAYRSLTPNDKPAATYKRTVPIHSSSRASQISQKENLLHRTPSEREEEE